MIRILSIYTLSTQRLRAKATLGPWLVRLPLAPLPLAREESEPNGRKRIGRGGTLDGDGIHAKLQLQVHDRVFCFAKIQTKAFSRFSNSSGDIEYLRNTREPNSYEIARVAPANRQDTISDEERTRLQASSQCAPFLLKAPLEGKPLHCDLSLTALWPVRFPVARRCLAAAWACFCALEGQSICDGNESSGSPTKLVQRAYRTGTIGSGAIVPQISSTYGTARGLPTMFVR